MPLVNEISLLNSATKLLDLWRGPISSTTWPEALRAEHEGRSELASEEQVRSGWGFTLAKVLAEEISRRFLTDLHDMQEDSFDVHVSTI